jgi:antitoxin component YwqK of YwqJK toxin-antitoxin module
MVNIRANIKGLSERHGSWHLRRMIKGNLINKTLGRVDIMQQEEAEKIAIDFLNGKREGSVSYWSDGQLSSKGNFKNCMKESAWFQYFFDDGTVYKPLTGTYKNGAKISD